MLLAQLIVTMISQSERSQRVARAGRLGAHWVRHGLYFSRSTTSRSYTNAFTGAVLGVPLAIVRGPTGKEPGKSTGSTSGCCLYFCHLSRTWSDKPLLEHVHQQAVGEGTGLISLVSLLGELVLIGGWTVILDAPPDGPLEEGFVSLTGCPS